MRLDRCDVLVVGAGPAGSMAARTAAENDVKVILIEEHPEVGVPVYCGEGLSLQGIKDAGLEPEPRIVSQKISKARAYAPNKDYVEMSSGEWVGYTLNRTEFDKALAERAVNAGVELILETRALNVVKQNDRITGVSANVKGENRVINADVVIGADGHSSIIRRSAGLSRWFPDVVTCAQYRLKDVELEDPYTNEFWMGEIYAPGGYAWVFPKSKDIANVGLGVRKKHYKPPIEYLHEFIAQDSRFKHARIVEKGGGICPVSGILDKIVDDGLMLVGDAAGELVPCTGAGIHTSVDAGKIAGKVATEAISEEDVSAARLSEYRTLFEERYGKRIKDSRKVIEMLDKFTDDDLNTLANILTGEDILSLANGTNVPITLAKLLKRSPLKLMRLIKVSIS